MGICHYPTGYHPGVMWGWGAKARVKNWTTDTYKTIVVNNSISQPLGGNGIGPGLWLSPESLAEGTKTAQSTILYRHEGIRRTDFRLGTSRERADTTKAGGDQLGRDLDGKKGSSAQKEAERRRLNSRCRGYRRVAPCARPGLRKWRRYRWRRVFFQRQGQISWGREIGRPSDEDRSLDFDRLQPVLVDGM